MIERKWDIPNIAFKNLAKSKCPGTPHRKHTDKSKPCPLDAKK
jgi:hypothetical protein